MNPEAQHPMFLLQILFHGKPTRLTENGNIQSHFQKKEIEGQPKGMCHDKIKQAQVLGFHFQIKICQHESL
jgi:hypothetical protein